jgi:hypothetical protein
MGLDMYLLGEKFFWRDPVNPDSILREDGYDLRSKILRLGYWRKHPNLHGYIVNTFASGTDHCQPVELDAPAIGEIIDAVKTERLPHTTGFFFGESDGTEMEEDLRILSAALDWLERKEPGVFRSVTYRASW